MFFSKYDEQKDSFITEIDTVQDNIYNSITGFLQTIKNKMSPWEKNFFILPDDENSFIYCPGPNIENLLFSNGLKKIEKSKLDLYRLEWLFSVAMGIYVLQSKNIEYFGLSDKTVLIDSKMRARIINISHNYYKNDTITAYPIYFYSPERSAQYNSSYGSDKLDEEEKKKSDVYSYGVFMHELVTRKKQTKAYFNNLPYCTTLTKLQNGAIQYMDLDNTTDVPLYDLLYKCLKKDSKERCTIECIIEYLLNIDKTGKETANEDYFDINLVDFDKYHKFIIDIFGFDKTIEFSEAKNRIISMIRNKSELITENIEINDKCTFDDLEKGYKKGLNFCHETIQKCYEKLSDSDQILYKKFVEENPEISDFQVMKVFYQHRFVIPRLLEELNKLSQSKNRFKEFPFKVQVDKQPNLFDVLYKGVSNTKITTEMKIKWLNSIIDQLKKLQEINCYLLFFSNKDIYLNDEMEAVLYVPEILEVGIKNKDEDFSKELKKRLKVEQKSDISVFYRAPELLDKNIRPEKIQFDKCALYSFGVLAKELFEFNLPWVVMKNLSEKARLKSLRNPHWRKFQSAELEKELIRQNCDTDEKESFVNNLYQCLNANFDQRSNINDICNIFRIS